MEERTIDISNDYKPQIKEDISTSDVFFEQYRTCLLYTSPSPRDRQKYRMPSSA